MEANPYQELARAFRGAQGGPDGLCMGTVISWPSELDPGRPHKVIAQGNTLERDDLLASPALLPYGLAAGAQVLLLPIEEGQRYIIICKVVEL